MKFADLLGFSMDLVINLGSKIIIALFS